MHKKSPSQTNYNSKLLQLELLLKNPMFSIKKGCDFHSLYTWHLSVVKATGEAHSWSWVLFPTASPQWLCFLPQPLVNQFKKKPWRKNSFFDEKSGEISSLVAFTGLANTSHLGGPRGGDQVQSKVLYGPFDACGPVGLWTSMHTAAVV